MGVHPSSGPGLAKTTKPRLVVSLARQLHCVTQHGLDALLATADTVSEGALIDGHWSGTSSINLPLPPHLSATQLRVLMRDPHLRLRIVRLAAREAAIRAPAALDTVRCEVSQRVEHLLLRIVVDVDAWVVHARGRVLGAPLHR